MSFMSICSSVKANASPARRQVATIRVDAVQRRDRSHGDDTAFEGPIPTATIPPSAGLVPTGGEPASAGRLNESPIDQSS